MLERVAIVIALSVAIALAVIVVRAWNARRTSQLQSRDGAPAWDSLGEAPDGRQTLVTFSSRSCTACHTAQAPAVSQVEQRLGSANLRVIKIDVAQKPDVAKAFGIMTVPSTVVLAPAGKVVAVNQGFAPSHKLIEQLRAQ
jgi:thiol-disulfide isomerase/thioredoxin